MKVKTIDLTNVQMNYIIGKLEDGVNIDATGLPWLPDESPNKDGSAVFFKPTTNWAHGGPIIDREKIVTGKSSYFLLHYVAWIGRVEDFGRAKQSMGDTALAAAMRCFISEMHGDEVNVPDNLL
jgi:hypothetical protein